MKEIVLPIILTIIGSQSLMTFLQFLITRKDNKKNNFVEIGEKLTTIDSKLTLLEKDGCRTQLLILIADYPERQDEIMKLGKHYFYDLKGDWYLTSLFEKWLEENEMMKPNWFN